VSQAKNDLPVSSKSTVLQEFKLLLNKLCTEYSLSSDTDTLALEVNIKVFGVHRQHNQANTLENPNPHSHSRDRDVKSPILLHLHCGRLPD
jgi:hypothetical protein